MTIEETLAAIDAAATTDGAPLIVPVFDDFASNGPFFTARWQSEDINGGISEDGWGDTMAAAPDNLLLVLTGKADDVDRRQRLRAAKNAQIRARAEADVRDADIEAEPSR